MMKWKEKRQVKLAQKYKEIKKDYPQYVILIKSGIFYEVLDDDAYIMRFLFDYKIKQMNESCLIGVPETAIKKVEEEMIREKIAYVTVENGKIKDIDKINNLKKECYDMLLKISKSSYELYLQSENLNEKIKLLRDCDTVDKAIERMKQLAKV